MSRKVAHIQRALFGPGVDSGSRLGKMLDLIEGESPSVFWPVFLDAWDMCDNTLGEDVRTAIALLEAHETEPSLRSLNPEARAFYDGLPDPVELWRGCARDYAHGFSWTVDRSIAEGFARGHRMIKVPDPVIARIAAAPKESIWAVFTERNEGEVLLNTDGLDIETEDYGV